MCGLTGVVRSKRIQEVGSLEAATLSLRHRGPDAQGIWWSSCGRVGFGHRRLSIIDLSSGGAQPMVAQGSGCSVTFNGEIYNYRSLRDQLAAKGYAFQSHSDTEVLLAAYHRWGEDCVDHLEGMFAFAIFDPGNQKVFLARDRAGEKPLFYHHEPDLLVFGSELKALFEFREVQRRIDPTALHCFLSFGFVPGDQCIVRGVKKLPPAHCLTLRLSSMQVSVRRYWCLPQGPAIDRAVDPHELLDELQATLSSAVKRQLVADVPIGVLLSGGVDSSLVTALTAANSAKVRTFTVSFGQSKEHDEARYAEIVARHFGTEHHVLQGAEDSADCLPLLTGFMDEPMIDSSIIPTFLVSRLVRQHCTVVLGGDGADELFGGYRSYDRLAWAYGKLQRIPHLVRKVASGLGPLLPMGFPARSWISGLGADLDNSLIQLAVFFNARERCKLLGGETRHAEIPERFWLADMPSGRSIVDRATRRDFSWYMPEDILVKVDRASMANSLEMRAPFLDRHVIEFAFSKVPMSFKAIPGARKILLKTLASRLLPEALNLQRKQGFSIPLARWIKDPKYRDVFEASLFRPNAVFEKTYVSELFKNTLRTGRNAERLFGLFILEDWATRYGISL